MKKIYFSLIALLCCMSASAATLYLTPNSNWKADGARFAIYYWNDGGDAWADMTAVDGETDLYSGELPDGYTNVIFCRMNPSAAANNWSNKWNQTADLTYDGTKNYFNISGTSDWDSFGSTYWSVYTPAGGDDSGGDDSGDTPITSEYVYSLAGSINTWSLTANAVEAVDGVCTWTFEEFKGEFKIVCSPSDDINWGDGREYGSNGSKVEVGTEYALALGGGNISLSNTDVTYTGVTVTMDVDAKTILIQADGTTEVEASWSLAGAFNSWNLTDTPMTETETAGVFTVTLEELSGEFKVIKNGDWAGSYVTSEALALNTSVALENVNAEGYNITIADNATWQDVTLTLTVDGDNVTLRAEAESTADTYMIVGDFNEWTFENNPINLLDDDNDNVYVGTIAEMSGVNTFKVVKNASWDTCYGTSGSSLTIGEAYSPSLENSGNIAFADQDVVYKEVTFTFDANTETLTVTATSIESLVTTWTLVGDFNDWSTATSLEFIPSDTPGVYTLSIDELSGAFKVLKNNAWGGSYITTDVFTTDAEFVLENRDEAGYNIAIAETYIWKNVVLTLTEGDDVILSATAGTVSGIEGVEIESNEAVEYFNLQGVRVENPENGLFIRKQGNKVAKVLVK